VIADHRYALKNIFKYFYICLLTFKGNCPFNNNSNINMCTIAKTNSCYFSLKFYRIFFFNIVLRQTQTFLLKLSFFSITESRLTELKMRSLGQVSGLLYWMPGSNRKNLVLNSSTINYSHVHRNHLN
jgi:hypothetical protein